MKKINTIYSVDDKNGNFIDTFYGVEELSKFLNRTIGNTKQTINRLKKSKDKKVKALGTTLYIYTSEEYFERLMGNNEDNKKRIK